MNGGASTPLRVGCLCRLGNAEGAEAAFEHARGSGVWSTADATTVNYLLNALSRDSEKAFKRCGARCSWLNAAKGRHAGLA